MPLTLNVEGADKHALVTSLAILVLSDSKAEINAANIEAVVNASGNNVPAYFPALYSTFVEKAGGVDQFFAGPSAGAAAPAAAGGAAAAAAPAAAKAPEKPKEEEVDALDGGMDMFGGGGAKTGDY